MSDPVGVAASAISIVSLGIQTCQGLVWYIDLQVNQKKDLAQSKASVLNLLEVLELLNRSIDGGRFSAADVKIIEHNVETCSKWLKKLKEKLEKYDIPTTNTVLATARLQAQRVVYPFKKGVLDKICQYTSDARSSLSLALDTLHLYVSQMSWSLLMNVALLLSRFVRSSTRLHRQWVLWTNKLLGSMST
jgi:hypothetical protein